jgi:hypothetical protein
VNMRKVLAGFGGVCDFWSRQRMVSCCARHSLRIREIAEGVRAHCQPVLLYWASVICFAAWAVSLIGAAMSSASALVSVYMAISGSKCFLASEPARTRDVLGHHEKAEGQRSERHCTHQPHPCKVYMLKVDRCGSLTR